MNELQGAIEEITGQIAGAQTTASYTVILGIAEARQLVDAAQLVEPLQQRCELLGRALNAVWCLVDEDSQKAITSLLEGERHQVKQ